MRRREAVLSAHTRGMSNPTIHAAPSDLGLTVLDEAIVAGAKALHSDIHRGSWDQARDEDKVELLVLSRRVLEGAIDPLLDGLATGVVGAAGLMEGAR